jgi:hypothetical protein
MSPAHALYSNGPCVDTKGTLPQYCCMAHELERAHRVAAQQFLEQICQEWNGICAQYFTMNTLQFCILYWHICSCIAAKHLLLRRIPHCIGLWDIFTGISLILQYIKSKFKKNVNVILYQQAVSKKIIKLLSKSIIKTIHIPMKKNINILSHIEHKVGLKFASIYYGPCECGKVYVGQSDTTTEIRCKEHVKYVHLGLSEKSVVAQHRFETEHNINFCNTSILDRALEYVDHFQRRLLRSDFTPENLIGTGVSISVSPSTWLLIWWSSTEAHHSEEKPKSMKLVTAH